MGTPKKLLLYALSGVLLGNIAAMIVVPMFLVWYETPGDPGALCNCVTTVRKTSSDFIRGQLFGALVGALLLLIIGIIVVRARSRRHPPAQAPADPDASKAVAGPR